MSELASAFVRIRPNTTGFKAEAEREVRKGLGGIGKIVGGAFAAVGIEQAVHAVAHAAASQQEELSVVRQAVKATSAEWIVHGHTVSETLRDQAVKFGFTVSDLAQGFTRIQVSTKDSAKTLSLLDSAMNISRARHLGLAQAAVVVAKAQAGNVTGLQRLGIVIPKVTANYDALKQKIDNAVAGGAKFSAAEKLSNKDALERAKALDVQATKTQVLAEIQTRFGGQAANFAQTAEGSAERFHEAVNELEVAVGNGLLPVLTEAAAGATKLFKELADGGQVQAFAAGTAQELASAYRVFRGIAGTVAPPVVAIAKALGQVAHLAGGGGIVAFALGFKAVSAAVAIDASIRAKWAKIVAAGGGASVEAAAAEKAESVALAELTAALVANTEALAGNSIATDANVASKRLLIASAGGVVVAERSIAASSIAAGAGIELQAAKVGRLASVSRGLFALAGGWSTVVAVGLGAAAFGIYKLATAEDDLDAANHRLTRSTQELDRATQVAADTRARLAALTAQIPQDKLRVAQAKLTEEQAKSALLTTHAGRGTAEFTQLQLNLIQAIQERRGAEKTLNDDQAARTKTTAASEYADKKAAKAARERGDSLIALAAKEQEVAIRNARAGLSRGRITDPTTVERAVAKARADAARRFADKADKDAETEKNKTLRRNEQLVAALARKTGRKPTDVEIRFILDNKDPKAKLADLLKHLKTEGQTAALAAHAAGEHMGRQLGQGVASAAEKAKATARQGGHGVGQALAQGGSQGVIQGIPGIRDAITRFVDQAVKAGKDAAESHSPSRRSAREIGLPLAEGVAAGIRDGGGLVEAATKAQAGRAIAGYSQGLAAGRRAELAREKKSVLDGYHALATIHVQEGKASFSLRGRAEVPVPLRGDPKKATEQFVGQGFSRAQQVIASDWVKEHQKQLRELAKIGSGIGPDAGRKIGDGYVRGIIEGVTGAVDPLGSAIRDLLRQPSAEQLAGNRIGAPLAKSVADGVSSHRAAVERAVADVRKQRATLAREADVRPARPRRVAPRALPEPRTGLRALAAAVPIPFARPKVARVDPIALAKPRPQTVEQIVDVELRRRTKEGEPTRLAQPPRQTLEQGVDVELRRRTKPAPVERVAKPRPQTLEQIVDVQLRRRMKPAPVEPIRLARRAPEVEEPERVVAKPRPEPTRIANAAAPQRIERPEPERVRPVASRLERIVRAVAPKPQAPKPQTPEREAPKPERVAPLERIVRAPAERIVRAALPRPERIAKPERLERPERRVERAEIAKPQPERRVERIERVVRLVEARRREEPKRIVERVEAPKPRLEDRIAERPVEVERKRERAAKVVERIVRVVEARRREQPELPEVERVEAPRPRIAEQVAPRVARRKPPERPERVEREAPKPERIERPVEQPKPAREKARVAVERLVRVIEERKQQRPEPERVERTVVSAAKPERIRSRVEEPKREAPVKIIERLVQQKREAPTTKIIERAEPPKREAPRKLIERILQPGREAPVARIVERVEPPKAPAAKTVERVVRPPREAPTPKPKVVERVEPAPKRETPATRIIERIVQAKREAEPKVERIEPRRETPAKVIERIVRVVEAERKLAPERVERLERPVAKVRPVERPERVVRPEPPAPRPERPVRELPARKPERIAARAEPRPAEPPKPKLERPAAPRPEPPKPERIAARAEKPRIIERIVRQIERPLELPPAEQRIEQRQRPTPPAPARVIDLPRPKLPQPEALAHKVAVTLVAKPHLDTERLAGAVRQLRVSGHHAGAAYGQGIVAGVTDKTDSVLGAVGSLLLQAVQRGRDAIGAHSPSEAARTGIGHSISDGIALGILDRNGAVVKTLTTQVDDAIQAGVQTVRDAVNSAKQNLNSIGGGLAGDIQKLFEKAGDAPAKATGAQAARLKELQARIQAGNADPETIRLAQTLSDQAVAHQKIAQQGGTDKADKLARSIADLTDHLNRGDIKTQQGFNQRLDSILRKAGVSGAKGDKELGIAFGDQLRADIRGLRDQAAAILAGPKVKGSGLDPQIVRPLDAIREQQRAVADAAANQRAQQLAEAKALLAEQKAHRKHLKDIADHTKGAVTASEVQRIIRNAEKHPQASLDALIAASKRPVK